jgi:hypothetical protein
MRTLVAFAVMALLAGCNREAGQRDPTTAAIASPSPTTAPPTDLVAIDSLAGEWRVAGIDGAEFDEPVGIALSGSDTELWWEPRCAGMAHAYRLSGLAIEFGPSPDAAEPTPAGAPPSPVCTIGLPPRLQEVMRAVTSAQFVGRTPANGVLLSGGGHSLLLFSQ